MPEVADDWAGMVEFYERDVEIEKLLLQHPGFGDTVAIRYRFPDTDESRLLVFVKSDSADNADVRRLSLKEVLPERISPDDLVQVATFPKGDDGTVDVKTLVAMATTHSAPRSEHGRDHPDESTFERLIREQFGELVDADVNSIGLDDDFFDLGGSSIHCVELFLWIEESFGVTLPISTIAEAPTARSLARIVQHNVEGTGLEGTSNEPLPEQWEWVLCILWAEILHVAEVKPHDDFFELGGTDVDVQRVVDHLSAIFGIAVSPSELVRAPTVAQFAALTRGRSTRSCLVPLTVTGSKTPFFCIAGLAGLALAFLPLARELGPEQPFYGLQAHGLDRRGRPDFTIEKAVARYVSEIRRVQPHGPYIIGGHSYGGVLALEVVHQLAEAGEDVALLVIFDAIVPSRLTRKSGAGTEGPAPTAKFLPYQPAIRISTLVRLPLAGLIRHRGFAQYEVFGLIGRIQTRLAKPLRPWSGESVVFISSNNPFESEIVTTWESLLTGSWSRVPVQGDHLSMLQRPHVSTLAHDLRDRLTSALAKAE